MICLKHEPVLKTSEQADATLRRTILRLIVMYPLLHCLLFPRHKQEPQQIFFEAESRTLIYQVHPTSHQRRLAARLNAGTCMPWFESFGTPCGDTLFLTH